MDQVPHVLFENNLYLIVGKPAGWLSIPARVEAPGDLVLSHWLRDKIKDSHHEIRVIHRLDRFTSGVMLFAKSLDGQREATQWFEKRIVKKTYQFLASPIPTRPAIRMNTPVDKKTAQTLFEVLEKGKEAFFGKATPLTGRFHQIREHAKAAGFPLLGDKAYGGKMNFDESGALESDVLIPRVCLHAASLELPFGVFEMPMPEDLSALWSKLKYV